MADDTLPHIRDTYSPLNELIVRVIRRFGDFTAASVKGDVQHMFMEFANLVVEDYRTHPYFDGRTVTYYTSANEARPIPDIIMMSGLLAHYAFQQMSEKAPGYQTLYYKTLNQKMWDDVNGNTAIQMHPMDGGSNKEQSAETDTYNGLPVDADG